MRVDVRNVLTFVKPWCIFVACSVAFNANVDGPTVSFMGSYFLFISDKIQNPGHSSLKGLCRHYGLSYSTASKGRRLWYVEGLKHEICFVETLKIVGRSNNFKKKTGDE